MDPFVPFFMHKHPEEIKEQETVKILKYLYN